MALYHFHNSMTSQRDLIVLVIYSSVNIMIHASIFAMDFQLAATRSLCWMKLLLPIHSVVLFILRLDPERVKVVNHEELAEMVLQRSAFLDI